MNVYEPLDKALVEINRYNLREFGKLRLAPKDELNVIRQVRTVYSDSTKLMQKRFRKACEDAFWMYLVLCGMDTDKALRMASGEITATWLYERMSEIDQVTRYRFIDEADRKEKRLMESMTIPEGRDEAVDGALKLWTRQIGWFGIHVTDRAALQAMQEMGVEKVRWNSEKDGKQCGECDERDGTVYAIGKVPPKPHHGCRCWLTPVR